MQVNIALASNNREQAATLRKAYYPGTTPAQTRDAFIFNQCVDRFNGKLETLKKYLKPDEEKQDEQVKTVQRMLTIKAESNERLKTIAASLGASVAATYRGIIAYSLDQIDTGEPEMKDEESQDVLMVQQMIKEKIALLETQLEGCNKTVSEIKELLGR